MEFAMTSEEFYGIVIAVVMITFMLWLTPQAIGLKPFCFDLNQYESELDKKTKN